jgi:dTDP-4-amino-4,6-dideoxygalactose transaminase
MKVSFLDLRIPQEEAEPLMASIVKVFNHGRLVMGPEIDEFEKQIADYCGRKHAISVSSGTDALYFALRALDLGSGDEVITTSLSWIATANAIALTGATPVFADILDDLNIDPQSVRNLVTPKTKALLVVDYTGRMCDMAALQKIAEQYQLHLIEDGSQAFGAEYQNRKCGGFGTMSAISHNPMKVFAACGEAGSILCDDPEIRERLISLRYNGTINRETCMEPSLNGRMDTMQAAILTERLKTLPGLLEARKRNAAVYDSALEDFVRLPPRTPDRKDVYYTYTIRSSRRDQLKVFLESKDIETKIQHLLLMPKQPAYAGKAKGEWQNAEKLVEEILCIPIHEKLERAQVEHVANSIRQFGTFPTLTTPRTWSE